MWPKVELVSVPLPVVGATIVALALAVAFGIVVAIASRSRRALLHVVTALPSSPRRSRALARIGARRCSPRHRLLFTFHEAHALVWEGQFARAVEVLDAEVLPAQRSELGAMPLLVKLEALLLDGRIEEARAFHAEHTRVLEALVVGRCDLAVIRGMLRFHEGDLAGARQELERAPRLRPSWAVRRDPLLRVAHFFLAAIAHREQRPAKSRAHLARAIQGGGDLAVVRWALAEWPEVCPGEPSPRRPAPVRRGPRGASLVSAMRAGLPLLVLRTKGVTRRRFTSETIVALALLDAVLTIGLRFVDYRPGAWFGRASSIVELVAPLALFFVVAVVATGQRGDGASSSRVLAGFLAAFPPLIIGSFAATHFVASANVGYALEALLGLWALLVFVRLVHTVVAPTSGRLVASAFLLVVGVLLPMHLVARTRFFWVPRDDVAREDWQRTRDELMFQEADRVHEIEGALAPERSGVADLWFVGAAGFAEQDVFLHEIESARALFDERFDTGGHSLLLANDPAAADRHPMAAVASLRHVLKAVGARMNTEEDILFLAVTSHGSEHGLALSFPRRSPYVDETLRPEDLREILDEAKIRWRVLLLLGCHSGVFVQALANEHTLIATAAARDRVSYGCTGGKPYTDFGQAVFAEQLPRERSFVTAFRNAAQVVDAREKADGITPSLPQIAEGAAIAPKLAALEQRLFEAPNDGH